jgi:alpha-D-xyloside xylohydrolase
MRITEGAYAIAPGVQYYTPDEVYEYHYTEHKLVVQGVWYLREPDGGLFKKLHGKMLSFEFSSPCENVIRVRAAHHRPKGGLDGKFPLNYNQSAPILIEDTTDYLVLTAGNVSLKITKQPWKMELIGADTGTLVSSSALGIGMGMLSGGTKFMGEKFSLAPGEQIYGLGERFSPFVRNGQSVTLWNSDYGTTADVGYKNIPFYLSSKGYGLFVNSTDKVEYEIATEDVEGVRFTVPGNELDYYFVYGPTPKEVLTNYTAITGRTPIIPKWSLGLWMTTSFTAVYDEAIITEHIDGMFERDLPLTVFHFDCYWMKERHWCDFKWELDAFPQPTAMLKRLKAKGLKICVWINPYISQLSCLFEEGAEKGYFLKNQQGDVYQIDWWQPGLAFVDFTNPDACAWYQAKLKALVDMGVDTFKTDFAESAPADAVYFNGHNGQAMHNLYTLLFNQVVFEMLEDTFGKDEAVVFARSATAGSQQYPVHWGGDCTASLTSMATELRSGLSFTLSGVPFWSHDIGGFYGEQNPDVYKRWIAMGLFSSHSRLHGDSTYRVPWNYDEESVDVLRHFTNLRHRLIPYLYSYCKIAHDTGLPVMRPMMLEFPDEPGCLYLDRQYMFGESFLVAPVFKSDGQAQYYLPPGEWTNFWTNERKQGSIWITETVDYMTVPLWVRENSIVPMGPADKAPFRNSFDDLILHVYNITGTAAFELYDAGRTVSITAERQANAIVVITSEAIAGFKIVLKGESAISSVEGADAWTVEHGDAIVDVAATTVRILL